MSDSEIPQSGTLAILLAKYYSIPLRWVNTAIIPYFQRNVKEKCGYSQKKLRVKTCSLKSPFSETSSRTLRLILTLSLFCIHFHNQCKLQRLIAIHAIFFPNLPLSLSLKLHVNLGFHPLYSSSPLFLLTLIANAVYIS